MKVTSLLAALAAVVSAKHKHPLHGVDVQKNIYQDDSKEVRQPNPAEPRSIGIERPLYTGINHHERVIQQSYDRQLGAVNQDPGHIIGTATRKHFRESDEDWRTNNVILKCEGYNDQRQKDACLKRAGVHMTDTQ